MTDESGPPGSGETRNVHHGTSKNVVQAGNIGSVNVTRDQKVAIAIIAAALVIAAAILFSGGGAEPAVSAPPPTTTGSPASPVPTEPLLVTPEQNTDMCESDWMTPKAPDQLSQPPDGVTRWLEWGVVADGVATEHNHVTVTVHGAAGPYSVVLTGMSVTVDRAAPRTGTRLTKRCGGPGYVRLVEIDLDEAEPRPTGLDLSPTMREWAEENGERAEPVRFPYEVSPLDSETFAVRAYTTTCDCAWRLHLHWASGGRRGTTVVDDDGRPFRVTATPAGTPVCSVVTDPLPCEVR